MIKSLQLNSGRMAPLQLAQGWEDSWQIQRHENMNTWEEIKENRVKSFFLNYSYNCVYPHEEQRERLSWWWHSRKRLRGLRWPGKDGWRGGRGGGGLYERQSEKLSDTIFWNLKNEDFELIPAEKNETKDDWLRAVMWILKMEVFWFCGEKMEVTNRRTGR